VSAPVRGRIWVLVAALFAMHFLLHVGFGFAQGAPDLLTVGLLLAAREIGLGRAAALGFAFGLLEDALSVLTFGANGVAMTLVGIGGAFTRDLFVGDSRVFVLCYLFVGKWVRDLIHWTMVGEGMRQSFVDQVLVLGGIGAAYASAVGIALVAVTGLAREA